MTRINFLRDNNCQLCCCYSVNHFWANTCIIQYKFINTL